MNETLLITGLLSLTVVAVGLTYWLVKHHYDKQLQWLKRDRKEKDLLVSAAQLQATPKFLDEVQAVIERLAKSGATDEHARHVEQYLDYSRRLLASIGVPARSVKEEAAYIEQYLALQKLLMGDSLTYGVIVSADVPDDTMLPTMLLFTQCQNAIKHGLMAKPGGGRLEVIITRHQDDIVVTVEDNGVGRKAASKKMEYDTRLELRILSEQIQLYNKQNERRIKIRVSSLRDEDKKVAGTRVETVIPVGYKFERVAGKA